MMTNNKYIDNKELDNKDYNKDINNSKKKSIDVKEKDLFNYDLISAENNLVADKEEIPYAEIIEYLNSKIGTHYLSTSRKTRDLIKARWREGYRLNDFKVVIDKKVMEWYSDNKMKMYLRPETLFSNKFESYLNQLQRELTSKDLAPFVNIDRFLKGGDL